MQLLLKFFWTKVEEFVEGFDEKTNFRIKGGRMKKSFYEMTPEEAREAIKNACKKIKFKLPETKHHVFGRVILIDC